MNKKFRNSLLAILSLFAVGTVAAGCSSGGGNTGSGKGPDYNYNFDEPLRAECDSFMTIDGKLDEEAWEGQNYLYWVGGRGNEIKATTLFTSKGLYVGIHADDPVIKHSGERYYFAQNSRFRIQVVQEDEINYNGNRGNIHPTRQFWFDIDAQDTLSRMERQYDAASYVKGEVNGVTEYMSVELFLPWNEMGYKEEELNEAGAPNAVKILIQYWTPSTGSSGFPGFTDDDKFVTYYTYDKDGSTCMVDRYSETDEIGYSIGGWTPGDRWELNEEQTQAVNTVNRTQILWFRKDAEGNAKSGGTHYAASVKVKAKQVQNMYPHVGIMTLSNKTTFSIYGVSTSSLKSGSKTLPLSAAQATDGGQWVATKNFNHTFDRSVHGGMSETITLENGVTVAPDEVYLTVVKRGAELYYFANDVYLGMENDERLAGECVVGLFANGQTTMSDWELVDYSDNTEELDDYLRGYVHFLSASDNGGGYVYIDRLVAKNGEAFNVSITPKPGYVLTKLVFTENGEEVDKYDYFLENAEKAMLSYTPTTDVHVYGEFKKLDKNSVQDVFFSLVDAGNNKTKLLGAKFTIRGYNKDGVVDNRFVVTGDASNTGDVIAALLKPLDNVVIEGREIALSGRYDITIECESYKTETFSFRIPKDASELPETPVEGDEYGVYDEDGYYTMSFALVGYPFGPVKVNGNTQVAKGDLFVYDEDNYYDKTNEVYTFTSSVQMGAANQYMKKPVFGGNFVFDGTVSLMEDAKYHPDDPTNIWRCGAVVGYLVSTGKGYIEFKTTAWKPGWLYVNYNGGTELGFNNFPNTTTHTANRFNKEGDAMSFKIARYNNVLYVYNVNGELAFTIDKFGLEAVNAEIVEGAKKLDAFNAGMKTMFGAGNEMAIGMYRMKSAEGGGAYKYQFSCTDNADVVKNQFQAVSLTQKSGVANYTMEVESRFQIEDAYLKDAMVTVKFSGIPATEKNYVLGIEFEGGATKNVFGSYDKAKGTFSASFPLSNNAAVFLDEYDFGPITVNGETVTTMAGIMLTENDDGSYGNKFNQAGGVQQFYTTKTAKGNFYVDFTVEVAEQNPTSGGGPGWAFGSGVGLILTAGNGKTVNFFTNAWEGSYLLMGIGSTLYKVSGFPRDNQLKAVGNQFNFKVLRYENVLYFFNCNNELIFHVDQTGINIDSPTATTSGTPVARNLMRETMISMLNAGDEMGFGIYREYLPKSEGAYNWYLDVETGSDITGGLSANVTLKDGESYTMAVSEGMALNGGYMTGAPITVKFTNLPASNVGYILASKVNGVTNYVLGAYDKASNSFEATFALVEDAEVWVEEYGFGAVKVNGAEVKSTFASALMLEQDSTGAWTGPETGASFVQYYHDKVYNGDYRINGTITTQSTNWEENANGNIWVTGGGFGLILSAGGNNWIKIFANAWEQGWFIQTNASGNNAIRVKNSVNMPAMKAQGEKMSFTIIRLDNVIYFFNDKGALTFHIDADGLTLDATTCSITHAGTDNAVLNQVVGDIKNFFAAGTENAIGVAQLNGAPNSFASYTWDIKTTNQNVADSYKANVSLKSGVSYTMDIVDATEFAGVYLKGSLITVQFKNVPAPVNSDSYVLAYKINGKTEVARGTYNATENTFTAKFSLTGNAEVWIEELITTASSATVNGATIAGAENVAFKNPLTGEYNYDPATSRTLGFYPNADGTAAKATGNFIADITLEGGNGFGEFRIYTSANTWIAFTAKDGANTAGNDGIYFYGHPVTVGNETSSWFTESRLNGNASVFTNPNIRGLGAMKLRIVNFDNMLWLFSNTYWDSNANAVATSSTYKLLCVMPSDATNPKFFNGMRFGACHSYDAFRRCIQQIYTAATANEFAFAITGDKNTSLKTNLVLEDNDANVTAFMNSIGEIPGITVLNGHVFLDNHGDYWTKDANGVWTQSTPDGNAYKVATKATGDFMMAMKINSTSSQANVRLWYNTASFVEIMSPSNNELFFTANGKWATETEIGAATTVFHNEDIGTVGDGWLDLMVVKSGSTFAIYICEYLDGSGNAATYSNWKLMYSYTSAGVQTYGAGFSQSWSNGWSGVQTGIKGLLNANEVAFAMACRNGKGSYKLNLIDDDATVATFMSSNKALASYPKA